MDPLKNAQNIIEGRESQNAKQIEFLSTRCLAYDALRSTLDSAEVFCGNDFPASPKAESANLLTLQALILQRLGEISALEASEEHGVSQPPAFEAEDNPPAASDLSDLHRLVMVHRKTLGASMRATAATFDEVNERITSLDRQLDRFAAQLANLDIRISSEEEQHRAACLLGGFDGRLLRIEKKLEALAEALPAQQGAA